MGTAFILLSPLPSEKDAFRENVNLLVQDLTGHNMDLGKYTEISVEQIKTMLPKSIVIENKRVSDSGREHQRLIYTGDQGQFRLKFQQYYWVKNEKAFVLTLTCEEEKFDLYKADGEMVLNSFRLK